LLCKSLCPEGDSVPKLDHQLREYESEQAHSEHSNGAALADLLSALEGKLSRDLDVQVLMPHPTGDPQKGAL
jgi:hypothetical protein